jgi:hypothetical protein
MAVMRKNNLGAVFLESTEGVLINKSDALVGLLFAGENLNIFGLNGVMESH